MSEQSLGTSDTKTASRTYRYKALFPAHVYIDEIRNCAIPQFVFQLQQKLIDFSEVTPKAIQEPSLVDFEEVLRDRDEEDFFRIALRQAAKVKKLDPRDYVGETEEEWMNLYIGVLDVLRSEWPIFEIKKDLLWDVPVGPAATEGAPLSVPKPDLTFGLGVTEKIRQRSQSLRQTSRSEYNASLAQENLNELTLHSEYRLGAFPSSSSTKIAYPFLILEAESDSNPIFFADNRAAGGAAKALGLLNDLGSLSDAENNLPVFAISTQGLTWNLYICFYLDADGDMDGAYHLMSIRSRPFFLANDGDLFYLQVVLGRIRDWAKSTYLLRVKSGIEKLYQGYLELTKNVTTEMTL